MGYCFVFCKINQENGVTARHQGKKPSKKKPKIEAIQAKLHRLQMQLIGLEAQTTNKAEQKTVALGTSRLNYCDPRITVSWCKRNNVELKKVFNRTLMEKFHWAEDVNDAWQFS
jgi:DNA topoisomerase-1